MISLFNRKPSATIATAPDFDLQFAEEYNAKAERVGVRQRVNIGNLCLINALRDAGISTYDVAAVEKYMDKKGTWDWRPARSEDWNKFRNKVTLRKTSHEYMALFGGMTMATYNEPIPYPVLDTMSKVIDRVKETAPQQLQNELFFVVASLNKYPDPFLGVGLGDEFFVIERWDEPSFRG